MSIDKFTADVLLSSLEKGNDDQVLDIYKAITESDEVGPTEEHVSWFKANKGKPVSIKGTRFTGVVESLNTSTRGLYPGRRYPILVRYDQNCGRGSGMLFEFDLPFLIVINE